MKVQYIVDHIDEYGHDFPEGCVAQHSASIAQARIDAGLCMKAAPDARLYRLAPGAKPLTVCTPAPVVVNVEGDDLERIDEQEIKPKTKFFKHKNT